MHFFKFKFRFTCSAFLVVTFFSTHIYAFKTGYNGIWPFHDGFEAQHEMITGEGLFYLCKQRGKDALNKSKFRELFLKSTVSNCNQFHFGASNDNWIDKVDSNPAKGLVLGSRFPDLLEMTGIDANMESVAFISYHDDVQIDTYRLFPHLHAQLSKYYNMFGGDQEWAARVIRDYLRDVMIESLLLANDNVQLKQNYLIGANNIGMHDLESSTSRLFHPVPWHQVEVGKVLHLLGDLYQKSPFIIIDTENNRLIHAAVEYGKFIDNQNNNEVNYFGMYSKFGINKNNLNGEHEEKYFFNPSSPLTFSFTDLPESYSNKRYFIEGNNGARYASHYLRPTLASLAIADYLEILLDATHGLLDEDQVVARVNEFIDKYFYVDLWFHSEWFSPKINQWINARYKPLPWYNFHFVDQWRDTKAPDVKKGREAMILRYTWRNSMPNIKDDKKVPKRFFLKPGDEESYQDDIFTVERDKVYIFRSWVEPRDSVKINVDDLSQEVWINPAFTKSNGQLKESVAFAYIPKGVKLCIETAKGGQSYGARKAAFDFNRERYRCRYGAADGSIYEQQFHIPKNTWIRIKKVQ